MLIGIPKEVKPQEHRVAATPGAVRSLVAGGHEVLLEAGAGIGSSFADDAFREAGATIVASAGEAWGADLVLKVKEPVRDEYGYLRPDLLLFTFLHLAADGDLTRALLTAGTTAIAYETVQLEDGTLPLLTPMSEVAGRMAPQAGAVHLARSHGGRGVLLGGVPGVEAGSVTVLGGGVVGTNAARTALGLGARVTVLDTRHARLQVLDDVFQGRLQTLASTPASIADAVARADLVVGAVLLPGGLAPRLVPRAMLATMQPGSVIVDVAVDQGGCVETIHPTTHHDPTYVVDGVVHYGVANMPGAVPNTSSRALSHQTLPYALQLADRGLGALEDPALLRGLSTHQGRLTCAPVGRALDLEAVDAREALAGAAIARSAGAATPSSGPRTGTGHQEPGATRRSPAGIVKGGEG